MIALRLKIVPFSVSPSPPVDDSKIVPQKDATKDVEVPKDATDAAATAAVDADAGEDDASPNKRKSTNDEEDNGELSSKKKKKKKSK